MKVAIYTRVSTDKQKTDSQINDLQGLIESNGWTDYEFYTDTETGSSTTRKGFNRMLRDVREGRVGTVCAWCLDRLGRDPAHSIPVVAEIQKLGVDLVLFKGGLEDNTTPEAKLLLGIQAVVAGYERSKIVERIKSGMRAAKADGRRVSRPRTVDYDSIRKDDRDGLSVTEIAVKYRKHPVTVRRILKAA